MRDQPELCPDFHLQRHPSFGLRSPRPDNVDNLRLHDRWVQREPQASNSGYYELSMQDMIDIFHILAGEQKMAAEILRHLGTVNCDDDFIEGVMKAYFEEHHLPDCDHKKIDPIVRQNLSKLQDHKELIPRLQGFMSYVSQWVGQWNVESDGGVDTPPTVTSAINAQGFDASKMTLTIEELAVLRWVAFVTTPTELLNVGDWKAAYHELCGEDKIPAALSEQPTVIIMVGPPGSGKTYSLTSGAAREFEKYNGPPMSSYVHIDPDFFLTRLCNTDNAHRSLANCFCHESFLVAIAEKRNIMFDGTGRQLVNTCGRVISRLKAANYRIFMCIVLAELPKCLERIAAREKETGRGVPKAIVESTVRGLKESVPVYIKKHADLADVLLFYENTEASTLLHTLVRREPIEKKINDALADADRLLTI